MIVWSSFQDDSKLVKDHHTQEPPQVEALKQQQVQYKAFLISTRYLPPLLKIHVKGRYRVPAQRPQLFAPVVEDLGNSGVVVALVFTWVGY